uniref:Uncharacterized protein n=1 Tax=Strongyloides stercoralis TaxID=6248 RepID=A0A0K0DXH2_STRER
MNGANIVVNNNNCNIINNQKPKKPPKRLLFTTKHEITILVICILSFFSQIGVYYCFSKVEYNGILIASIASGITWAISIPFIISSFEKFRYQRYLHLTYMFIQSLLIIIGGVRLTQYTCYTSVFKTFGIESLDPLKNIKYQYLKEGFPNWEYLYIYTFVGTIFLCVWIYSVRTSYNLYRRIYIIKNYKDYNKKSNTITDQKQNLNVQNMGGINNNPQNFFTLSPTLHNLQMT